MFEFNKATRKQAKARIAFAGPSGSGKTTDALVTATILAGGTTELSAEGYVTDMSKATTKIAFIDTEKGSASLYADQFDFDVLELQAPYSPLRFKQAHDAAIDAGYRVIVVDGLTPFWNGPGGVLEIVEAAGKGNSYTGWKQGTPAQQMLVETITGSDAHIIATMRAKTEYTLVQNAKGKMEPQKVGMAPEQRAGLEYEFTVVADVDLEHSVIATKTRCPALTNRVFQAPVVKEMAETFAAWLNSGEVLVSAAEADKERIRELGAQLGFTDETLLQGLNFYAGARSWGSLTAEGAVKVIDALVAKVSATQQAQPTPEPETPAALAADPYGITDSADMA